MCKIHWSIVPASIRSDVKRHYREGQCIDKHPSREWHDAADLAIGFVAMREGCPLRNSELEALLRRGYRTSLIRYAMRRFGDAARESAEAHLNQIVPRSDDRFRGKLKVVTMKTSR